MHIYYIYIIFSYILLVYQDVNKEYSYFLVNKVIFFF